MAILQVLQPGDPSKAPPPARIGRRIAAALLDIVLFVLLYFGLTILWGDRDRNTWRVEGLAACSLFAFIPIYWFGTETWWGGTPGKLLVGLEVFSLTGFDLSAWQAVRRNIIKLLDSPFLYTVGMLVAFTNPLRQTAGDLWAKTMVTESKALRTWRYGTDGRTFNEWLGSFKKADDPAGPVA